MKNLLFVLSMALIDLVVLSLMKYQLDHYNPLYFLIAFIFYGCQPIIFYYSLKNGGKLGLNNILWDLLSDFLVLIVAIYLFHEILRPSQMMGIFLAFISIYLLNQNSF